MQIIPLRQFNSRYNRYSYLIPGEVTSREAMYTIIDPGMDEYEYSVTGRFETEFTMLPMTRIILTHYHPEYLRFLPAIKKRHNGRVFAFSDFPGVDERITDGQVLSVGNSVLEALHTPGRFHDSICLYSPSEKALFSGVMRLNSSVPEGSRAEYVETLIKIACRDIRKIYSAYDTPMNNGCREMIFRAVDQISGRDRMPHRSLRGWC